MSAGEGQKEAGTRAADQEDAPAAKAALAALTSKRTAGEALDRSGLIPSVLSMMLRNRNLALGVLWLIATGLATIQGPAFVILVLAGTGLVLTISLFWSSVRTLFGETPLSGADAYAIAAPRAEEEQKQAILRALKDLEFERAVGKISDEDYTALVAKYRMEAKRLLRVLEEDARPRRERVLGLVQERLIAAGLEAPAPAEVAPAEALREPKPDGKKAKKKKAKDADKAAAQAEARTVEIIPEGEPLRGRFDIGAPGRASAPSAPNPKTDVDATWKSQLATTTKESPAYAPPTKKCGGCGTKNDPDAVFCKKCGSKVFAGDPPKVAVSEPADENASLEKLARGADADGESDGEADASDADASDEEADERAVAKEIT